MRTEQGPSFESEEPWLAETTICYTHPTFSGWREQNRPWNVAASTPELHPVTSSHSFICLQGLLKEPFTYKIIDAKEKEIDSLGLQWSHTKHRGNLTIPPGRQGLVSILVSVTNCHLSKGFLWSHVHIYVLGGWLRLLKNYLNNHCVRT